jgi:hypothetical protein
MLSAQASSGLLGGPGLLALYSTVSLRRPRGVGAGEGAGAIAVVGNGWAKDVAGRGGRGSIDLDGGIEDSWVILKGLSLEVDRNLVASVDFLIGLDESFASR